MLCVSQVQQAVHGVTVEECQTALQNQGWSVLQAEHYLKVPQLGYTEEGNRIPNRSYAHNRA